MSYQDRPKDPLVKFRNVVLGRDKKLDKHNPEGGQRIQLYLSPEDAVVLRESIDQYIETPEGVKIDLHVCKRENRNNGNVFDSAFAFVKPVEPQAAKGGPARNMGYAPKAGVPAPATVTRTQKVQRELE